MSVRAPWIVRATTAVTARYGELVLVNADAGGVVVTLPRPSVGLAPVMVKKTDASANPVTVTPTLGALVDGAATYPLTIQYQAVTIMPTGTAWVVVAKR